MLKDEIEAIQEIRKELPNAGQRTLARTIVDRKFADSRLNELAARAASRPYFSVYGVIRRFDAKNAVAA